jgi:multicomponent Na+:H+ antiporter subunit A
LQPGLEASIALVALGPFVAALLAPLVQRFAKPFARWILALVPGVVFLALWSLLDDVVDRGFLLVSFPWVPDYGLELSFLIDGLSLTFALTISGIGALIVLYSGAYLKGHPHLGRFFSFLLAFMGSMLGLVLADSMLALFVFWELTAVTSFLLIGFDHKRQAARRAAFQALVITNIGGMALLVGFALLHQIGGSWELSALRELEQSVQGNELYGLVLACIILGAFTKSAQVPFHFWLPNAMEAPTPVSAYLHSAAMVQAGVYLLARMTPVLGGTVAWSTMLVCFGSVSLLWGAAKALRQTDLKHLLAQSTIGSLGLLVLLLGLGSEAAIASVVIYFVAHALYKAGLFMVVGAIDHKTGTRDITALSGVADRMPVTFICAALAGVAMIGLPPSLAFFAKEEMLLAALGPQWLQWLALGALVIGNALLAAAAAIVVIKPFLGHVGPTPKSVREAPIAMLVGPLVLGGTGIVLALGTDWFGKFILEPAASSILDLPQESHLAWSVDPASPVIWLSLLTWILGYFVYRQSDRLRALLARMERGLGLTADHVFDAAMFTLLRFAGWQRRLLHHGRLELYLVVVFAVLALALLVPVFALGGLEVLRLPLGSGLMPYEWGVLALGGAGLLAVVLARTRLIAILALGVQGAAVALVFLLFAAPDLAFTQLMVEVLSVIILTLVMTRLRLDERDPRPLEDWTRDGALAVVCGGAVSLVLLVVLSGTLDTSLSDFFAATSVPLAHGANIVNVILVDYRGLDTLGEIAVVMAAAMAVVALLRTRRRASPRQSQDSHP